MRRALGEGAVKRYTQVCSRTPRSPALLLFFFQAEDGIRDLTVTGVQTCALPIFAGSGEPSPQSKLIVESFLVSIGLVRSMLSKYVPSRPGTGAGGYKRPAGTICLGERESVG